MVIYYKVVVWQWVPFERCEVTTGGSSTNRATLFSFRRIYFFQVSFQPSISTRTFTFIITFIVNRK